MTNEEIEQIVKQYELSQQELDDTVELIFQFLKKNASRKENPIAIVVGGQSGAGKTGLIGYANSKINEDAVIIDNDTYREFHPKVREINTKYPDLFTECTDQLSFYATPIIIEKMIKERYNLVIHQTLKSNRIADDAMKKLCDAGYIVGVMCLAVDELESNLSMIERCLAQQQIDGTCRWVPQQNHDFAYNGIPSTLDYIEKESGNYHFIQVLMRGKEKPTLPRLIYSSLNKNNTAEQNAVIDSYGLSEDVKLESTARKSLEYGRKLSHEEVLVHFYEKLELARKIDKNVCGESLSEAKRRLKILDETVANESSKNGKFSD